MIKGAFKGYDKGLADFNKRSAAIFDTLWGSIKSMIPMGDAVKLIVDPILNGLQGYLKTEMEAKAISSADDFANAFNKTLRTAIDKLKSDNSIEKTNIIKADDFQLLINTFSTHVK